MRQGQEKVAPDLAVAASLAGLERIGELLGIVETPGADRRHDQRGLQNVAFRPIRKVEIEIYAFIV